MNRFHILTLFPEMVMDGLKELDEVAYIRFASVYRQFKDVQSFMEELQLLLDSQKKQIPRPIP